VSRNIAVARPDPDECPDPFAWTLLLQCRTDPASLAWFVEKLWAKLLPSRAQLDQGAAKVVDGKLTIELIERIQAMRDEAVETSAHVGPSPHAAAPRAAPTPALPDAFEEVDP